MTKGFFVELTTLCMIENQKGEILVQDRQKPDWPGWTFPGGHVEKDEALTTAVIREIKEECGLIIQPTFMGVAEWRNDPNGARELAGLYYARVASDAAATSDRGGCPVLDTQNRINPRKISRHFRKAATDFLRKQS